MGAHGTYRESGHTQKNPKLFHLQPGVDGVLGGACLQSWFSPKPCLSHRALPVPGHLLGQLERLAPNTCPSAAPLAAAPCCPFCLPLCSGKLRAVESHRTRLGGRCPRRQGSPACP